MNCLHCGQPLRENDDYCKNCNYITLKKLLEDNRMYQDINNSIDKFIKAHESDIISPLIIPKNNIQEAFSFAEMQFTSKLTDYGHKMLDLEIKIASCKECIQLSEHTILHLEEYKESLEKLKTSLESLKNKLEKNPCPKNNLEREKIIRELEKNPIEQRKTSEKIATIREKDIPKYKERLRKNTRMLDELKKHLENIMNDYI